MKTQYKALYRQLEQISNPDPNMQSQQRFRACAQAGILRHAIPKEFGGFGDGFVELCDVYTQLCHATLDPGLLLSLHAHLWGSIFPLIIYGNCEQQQRLLPKLLSGEIIAGHAITEVHAGSDLAGLTTTAVESADYYLLTGHKRYITNTPIADAMLVYANLGEQRSAFWVEAQAKNAIFSNQPCVTGFAGSPMGDVILADCPVERANLIGNIGSGTQMIQSALELERAFLFSGILGLMQWQLEDIIKFVKSRQIAGKALACKQVTAHKVADLKIRLDNVKLWLQNCAHLKDQKRRINLVSAQTKLVASEAFLQSCLDHVQILGAKGLETGCVSQQWVQDAMAGKILSGTSEVQKNIIAAFLGVRGEA